MCNDAELQTAQLQIVEDINSIQLHSRAGSTLTLTAESETPPGINCSLMGKADRRIICQGERDSADWRPPWRHRSLMQCLLKLEGSTLPWQCLNGPLTSRIFPQASGSEEWTRRPDEHFRQLSPILSCSALFFKAFQNGRDGDASVCHLLWGHEGHSQGYHTGHQ